MRSRFCILSRAAVALSLLASPIACVSVECDATDAFCDPFALILYRLDVAPDCLVRGEVPAQGWIFFSGSPAEDDSATNICGLRDGSVILAANVNDADSFAQGIAPIVPFLGGATETHFAVYQVTGAGTVRRWTFFGGPTANYNSPRIAESADGGFYLAASGSGAFVTSYLGLSPLAGPAAGADNVVLLRFGPNFNLLWYTYLGGAGADFVSDIVPTDDGGVILVGDSDAAFTIQGSSPLQPYTGARDIVIYHVNKDGTVEWFSFFGSTLVDVAVGVERIPIEPLFSGLAASNDRFIVGGTANGDVAAYAGLTPARAYAGGIDAFTVSFDRSGNFSRYAFYGVTGNQSAASIQVMRSGEIALGATTNADIPVFDGLTPLNSYVGGADAWLLRLNPDGSLRSHRFLGSSLNENDLKLAESSTGDLLVGLALGADANFGVTSVTAHAGGADAGLVRINFADEIRSLAFYGGATTEGVLTLAPTEDGGAILGGEAPSPGFAPPSGTPILEAHTGTSGDEYYLRVFADGRTTR